ncbi:MAG TPA: glycosyltransferase family 9 protein [Ignavibacteria bacterium]
MLVNTGKIGDLIISSVFLDNDELFPGKEIFFLFGKNYKDLFFGYEGKINIIYYDPFRYKWNLFYRFRLLKNLRSYGFSFVYNVSPARGFIGDELSLLSGAEKTYATCSNMKYLGKYFGKVLNGKYSGIIYQDVKNEFKKLQTLVRDLSAEENHELIFHNIKSLHVIMDPDLPNDIRPNEFILISPMVSDMERSWGIENYKTLTGILSKKNKIILIGSFSEIQTLKFISGNLKNVFVIAPSLKLTPSVINSCRIFIGNNSGLSHIAIKLGKPTVAIIDGGFFDWIFPINEDYPKNVFIYNKLDCFGCDWKCIYKEPLCLTKILVEEVLYKSQKLLEKY